MTESGLQELICANIPRAINVRLVENRKKLKWDAALFGGNGKLHHGVGVSPVALATIHRRCDKKFHHHLRPSCPSCVKSRPFLPPGPSGPRSPGLPSFPSAPRLLHSCQSSVRGRAVVSRLAL